ARSPWVAPASTTSGWPTATPAPRPPVRPARPAPPVRTAPTRPPPAPPPTRRPEHVPHPPLRGLPAGAGGARPVPGLHPGRRAAHDPARRRRAGPLREPRAGPVRGPGRGDPRLLRRGRPLVHPVLAVARGLPAGRFRLLR